MPTDRLGTRGLIFLQYYLDAYVRYRTSKDFDTATAYLLRASKLARTLLHAVKKQRCVLAPMDEINVILLLRHANRMGLSPA